MAYSLLSPPEQPSSAPFPLFFFFNGSPRVFRDPLATTNTMGGFYMQYLESKSVN